VPVAEEPASADGADPTLLSAVLDEAPMPLWVIGRDGTVQFANKAAVDMLGYRSTSDVVGAPSHDTLHRCRPDGSPYPAHTCPILELPAEHSMVMPEWFIARSGRPVPVTWSTRSLGRDGSRLLTFDDASDSVSSIPRRAARNRFYSWAAATAEESRSRAELRGEILDRIRERCSDPDLTVAKLAAEFHLSVRSLQVLLAEEGYSPAATIRRMRLELAAAVLAHGGAVQEACRTSGFTNVGTFARAFRRAYGTSPSEWARSVALVG
jgi:PAS domain S-box-containing protein